jgi:hypothetical protein
MIKVILLRSFSDLLKGKFLSLGRREVPELVEGLTLDRNNTGTYDLARVIALRRFDEVFDTLWLIGHLCDHHLFSYIDNTAVIGST